MSEQPDVPVDAGVLAVDRIDISALTHAAERLDSLAETADVMDDVTGAERLREAASDARLRAMKLIDGSLDG